MDCIVNDVSEGQQSSCNRERNNSLEPLSCGCLLLISFILELNGVLGDTDLLCGAPNLFEYSMGFGNDLEIRK